METVRVGKYKTTTEFTWLPKYINGKCWFLDTLITTYKKVDGNWEVISICDEKGIIYK